MTRRAFFEMTPGDEEYLRHHMDCAETVIARDSLDAATILLAEGCPILSPFIHSKLDRKSIDALPSLKMISTRSTGYDHIDLEYCRAKGIVVCNVPVYGDNTVAEHTFALILALSRKIIAAHNRAHTGNFALSGLQGFDLRKRTIGVVGTGHIGVHVIRIARGFMMNVVAYDARPDKRLADALDFEYTRTLDDLLAVSDIVTLHTPLVPGTQHLIHSGNMPTMKRGALLINTARGGLIETDALLEGLSSGRLGGAGLDVFEGETLITEEKQLLSNQYDIGQLRTLTKNLALFRHENVVVTPHIAFNSNEALERIMLTTIQNIQAFEAGNIVNPV